MKENLNVACFRFFSMETGTAYRASGLHDDAGPVFG